MMATEGSTALTMDFEAEYDLNVERVNPLAEDAVANSHIPLLGLLYGELSPKVIWKVMYLSYSQCIEQRCTMLSVVTDYIVNSPTLLENKNPAHMPHSCSLMIRVLAECWQHTLPPAKKHLDANSFVCFNLTLARSILTLRSYNLHHEFDSVTKLSAQLRAPSYGQTLAPTYMHHRDDRPTRPTMPAPQILTESTCPTTTIHARKAHIKPVCLTTTTSSRHITAIPVRKTTAIPVRQTTTTAFRQTTMPFRRTTTTTSLKTTSMASPKTTTMRSLKISTMPVRKTTTLLTRQTSTTSLHQTTVIPVRRTAKMPPRQTTTMPVHHTSTMPPRQTTTMTPRQTSDRTISTPAHQTANNSPAPCSQPANLPSSPSVLSPSVRSLIYSELERLHLVRSSPAMPLHSSKYNSPIRETISSTKSVISPVLDATTASHLSTARTHVADLRQSVHADNTSSSLHSKDRAIRKELYFNPE